MKAGGPCSTASDCCSGACLAGKCPTPKDACRVAGETCGADADCCGGSCGTLDPGLTGCLLLGGCRVTGETCTGATDCCSGLCQVAANGLATCKALPGCKVIAERCVEHKNCCSGVCGADGRCQGAGGCFRKDERCQSNDDCCSGTCRTVPDGVLRCAETPKCKPVLRFLRNALLAPRRVWRAKGIPECRCERSSSLPDSTWYHAPDYTLSESSRRSRIAEQMDDKLARLFVQWDH
jgi:hypothetical protein